MRLGSFWRLEVLEWHLNGPTVSWAPHTSTLNVCAVSETGEERQAAYRATAWVHEIRLKEDALEEVACSAFGSGLCLE